MRRLVAWVRAGRTVFTRRQRQRVEALVLDDLNAPDTGMHEVALKIEREEHLRRKRAEQEAIDSILREEGA